LGLSIPARRESSGMLSGDLNLFQVGECCVKILGSREGQSRGPSTESEGVDQPESENRETPSNRELSTTAGWHWRLSQAGPRQRTNSIQLRGQLTLIWVPLAVPVLSREHV
jgi:hypothetical protein